MTRKLGPPDAVEPFLAFTIRMSHASARDEDAPAALKAWAALARKYLKLYATDHDGQPMNPSGRAADDALAPYGLAQTTTPSGAGPTHGCPQSGSSTTTAPEASGKGAGTPSVGT